MNRILKSLVAIYIFEFIYNEIMKPHLFDGLISSIINEKLIPFIIPYNDLKCYRIYFVLPIVLTILCLLSITNY